MGGWTGINGPATLHGCTSDQTDTTWANGPGNSVLCELGFPAMTTPEAGTVTFTVRYKQQGGPEFILPGEEAVEWP